MAIGEKVKFAREQCGYTQRDLSSVSGVSHAEISRIETGIRKSVGSDSLIRLCNALKVSSDWLLDINRSAFVDRSNAISRKFTDIRKVGVTHE